MRNHRALPAMLSRRLWNRDFILVLLVCAIASFTNSVFISILPVYVLDLGGTNALTGLMTTGLTALGVLTRLAVAPLIDRVGRKKLLVLGSGLYAVNALLFCFVKDLNAIFVLRVIHGFTQGVFFPVPPTMVADISPEDLLVDAMGFFGVSSSIVFAVTPAIGLSIYEHFGPSALFTVATAAAVIAFGLALPVREHYQRAASMPRTRRADNERATEHRDRAFWRQVLMPSMIVFCVYVGNSAITNFLTPCGLSRGLERISLYFLVNNLAVICARLTVGRVIHVLPQRVCIGIGILLCGVGTGMIAIADGMGLMILSALLCGVGITAVSQLLQVQMLTSVPDNRRGVANTAMMLLSDAGNGAGAAAWGAASSGMGYAFTYALAGVATMAAFLFHRPARREA